MRERAESRRKIEKGIEKRKRESGDRAKHMGLVVKDKKTVADTSRKLRLSTTSEGAREVKQAIKKAAKETAKEFENQNKDLDKKIKESKKAEKDLQQRTKNAKRDAVDSKTAAGHIKEAKAAKNLATRAEHAAKKDAEFTKKQKRRQEHDRNNSEKRREKQKRQLTNTKLKW